MASNEILCLLWEGWNRVRAKYTELSPLACLCYCYLLVLVTQSSVSGVSEPALKSHKSKRAQHSCLHGIPLQLEGTSNPRGGCSTGPVDTGMTPQVPQVLSLSRGEQGLCHKAAGLGAAAGLAVLPVPGAGCPQAGQPALGPAFG